MTELRINIAAFTRACRRIREERDPAAETGFAARRDYYREDCDFSRTIEYVVRPAIALSDVEKAASLRSSLVSASIAAGQYGASKAQIEYIVALSEKSRDFTCVEGRLTKAQASIIIDQMKREAARG